MEPFAEALGASKWQPPRWDGSDPQERQVWESAIPEADPAYIPGQVQLMMAAHLGLRSCGRRRRTSACPSSRSTSPPGWTWWSW